MLPEQVEPLVGKTVVVRFGPDFRFVGDVVGVDTVSDVLVMWETAPAPGDEELPDPYLPQLRTIPLEQVTSLHEHQALRPT